MEGAFVREQFPMAFVLPAVEARSGMETLAPHAAVSVRRVKILPAIV